MASMFPEMKSSSAMNPRSAEQQYVWQGPCKIRAGGQTIPAAQPVRFAQPSHPNQPGGSPLDHSGPMFIQVALEPIELGQQVRHFLGAPVAEQFTDVRTEEIDRPISD